LPTSSLVPRAYVPAPTPSGRPGRTLDFGMSGLTRSDLFDAAVGASVAAALVVITSQIDVADDERGLDAVAYASLAVAGSSLALRRRLPAVALMIASAAVGVYAARDYPGGPIWVMPLVAVYSVAACWPRRRTVPVVALALLTVLVPGLVFHRSGGGPGLVALVYVGWAAAGLLLGEAARARHERIAAFDERARYLEQSREQEARRRVAEERLRIARDVHDVVAHSLASIALQAGVGGRLAARDPRQAQDALARIRRASTDALGELRVVLDLLRSEDAAEARDRTPALADLDRLVSDVGGSGLEVRVDVRGRPHPLPAVVELAAYRILQESLTNVIRHAASATATVTLTYVDSRLELEVVDQGRGSASTAVQGGHGIRGMRERAAAVGGRLEAAPGPQGGFRVWAQLPAGAPQ
jgi:signal transduction histidine kinase